MAEMLLEMRHISKSFPGVHALKGVNFSVQTGEIVCLLGENGAGKSTLMKILAGVHEPDEGSILFEGKPVHLRSTKETFALADKEIRTLFELMRDLKGRGIAVVFISHKLNEVLEITDRVVCLKDGQNSGSTFTSEATEGQLVSMMVGRELDRMYSRRKG